VAAVAAVTVELEVVMVAPVAADMGAAHYSQAMRGKAA